MSQDRQCSANAAADRVPADFDSWSPQRRDFLRMLAYGGGALAVGGLAAGCGGGGGPGIGAVQAASRADTLRAALLANASFWAQVKQLFVLNPQRLFMNIGTAGSMPQPVLDLFATENRAYAVESSSGYSNFATLRTRIAPGFGVDPEELVVSYNTSAGMSHAVLGIPWQTGDVVVTTNHEHPGGDVPLQIAQQRYGIIVRRVILPSGDNQTPDDYKNLFRAEVLAARAAGQRVRAIMWSSPTFLTGTMLPIPQIMDVCREFGLISICDGAHLPGMMAYNYGDLGVDFMAGAGHKWQCGPGSTGILIIRNKVRSSNQMPLPPYFPIATSSFQPTGVSWPSRTPTGSTTPYNIGNLVQSLGSIHVPMINALGKACDEWDRIGRKNIETYILTLSSYIKERIVERFGVEALYSPRHPDLLSALTSFNPFQAVNPALITQGTSGSGPSATLVSRMSTEAGIVVRNTSTPVRNSAGTLVNHFPIRISTHLWHSAADVDRALDAIADIAGKIARGQ